MKPGRKKTGNTVKKFSISLPKELYDETRKNGRPSHVIKMVLAKYFTSKEYDQKRRGL